MFEVRPNIAFSESIRHRFFSHRCCDDVFFGRFFSQGAFFESIGGFSQGAVFESIKEVGAFFG